MTTLVVTIFVASLVGSLHCAGMCGGVLALAVGVAGGDRSPRWRLHAAYHLGRLATYAALGAAAGAVGSTINRAAIASIERPAAIIAGAAMILLGAAAMARVCGARLPTSASRMPVVARLTQRAYDFAFSMSGERRAALIGVLTGLLPCGWLWAFVAAAGATGDTIAGALAMAVFWSGTLPVMASLGAGVQALAGPLRRHLPKVTAATLIVVGAVTIVARSMNPIALTSPPATDGGLRAAVRSVDRIDHDSLPCCTDDHADRTN